MKTVRIVTAVAVAGVAAIWGCSTVDDRLGFEASPPPSEFVGSDGGSDATSDAEPSEQPLVSYCPSSECPTGWTTCPGSRFPCDVNLLGDPSNCGGCGSACPAATNNESFVCVQGACVMTCNAGLGRLDCDGVVDNGCETSQPSNAHCGACGNACSADKPCVWQDQIGGNVGCGCPAGKLACTSSCIDVESDDRNCGQCGEECDPAGGEGAPQYPNMAYGCLDGTCGKLKCKAGFLDCDGNRENGCEASDLADSSCGGCGNVCPTDQHCYENYDKSRSKECLCAGDRTLCKVSGSEHAAYCTDLQSDERNCGACGAYCWVAGYPPSSRFACDHGACVLRCNDGTADCNGNEKDGCEVDVTSDPDNCGGCGVACDARIGQACVAGSCVVAPCEPDAGELPQ